MPVLLYGFPLSPWGGLSLGWGALVLGMGPWDHVPGAGEAFHSGQRS